MKGLSRIVFGSIAGSLLGAGVFFAIDAFTQIMQMQQRFAKRAMQEDEFVQETPGLLSKQGRTMRVETSPLVRMAGDKPAVKIIQDTPSADSNTDLFEGILRDAENDLIMTQKPWLSGQPCPETKENISYQITWRMVGTNNDNFHIRQLDCKPLQTKKIKNLVGETLPPA